MPRIPERKPDANMPRKPPTSPGSSSKNGGEVSDSKLRSGLFEKYGKRLDDAVRRHANDPTRWGKDYAPKYLPIADPTRPQQEAADVDCKPNAAPAKGPFGLDPIHYRKLRESGLNLITIWLAKLRTETNTVRLRRMLRGSPAVAPALILPFFDRHGKQVDYAVARMIPPHIRPKGTPAKYLMPTGGGNRAYFPPVKVVWEAVNTKEALVVITEGIFKALAASQAGVPCIGLMGVWNWVVRDSNPRALIPDLAGMDWQGRLVLIVFDFDSNRKSGVNHATAELARVLTEHGADVRILQLPPGPRGPDCKPMKQAIDDYIVRLAGIAGSQKGGEAAFRQWVQKQLEEPPVRLLTDWRAEMADRRLIALAEPPGVHLDNSPTGAGKSHVDGIVMQALGNDRRSLTLLPTHANGNEAVSSLSERGIFVSQFPRLDSTTCLRYDEATAVIGRGLSFPAVLCPECPYRDGCVYREEYDVAIAAQHTVATHARGTSSMPALTKGRSTIMLHENPMSMLRPTIVTKRGLLVVDLVAKQAEDSADDAEDRAFYRHLGRIARELDGWHNGTNTTVEVPLPAPAQRIPRHVYRDLNQAVLDLGSAPPGEAMQIALAAVMGQLSLIVVAVDELPAKGGEVKLSRSLVGVSRTDLPLDATVLISDATSNPGELEIALERTVSNLTPSGRLDLKHAVLQVIPARDVTMGRESAVVANVLRGLLHDLSRYKRVGLLTHQKHAKTLPDLVGEPYQSQIAMVDYFGSGLSRGSNQWIETCDALIVLGTPRVGGDEVRRHVIRLGKRRAGRLNQEDAGWTLDYWSGLTESGDRVTVRTPHYKDHDWHAAYCSVVRSELIQAIGRGRGILPEGIPVYVVSTENLAPSDREDGRNGFLIADHPFLPLTEVQLKVLGTLHDQRGNGVRRTSSEIAGMLSISRQRAHKILVELETARRVRRVGKAGGWVARLVNPFL